MNLGHRGGNYKQFPLNCQDLTDVLSAWFFYTSDTIFLLCFILMANKLFHNQIKKLLWLNSISFECVAPMQQFLINILFNALHCNILLCLAKKNNNKFSIRRNLLVSAKAICLSTAGMCYSLAFRGIMPAVSYGDLE